MPPPAHDAPLAAAADVATPPQPAPLAKRLLAEAIGTGTIVGGGCGAVCAAVYVPGYALGPLGISVAFGASVALAVYATRDVSGAHLNPAITAMLAVHRPQAISHFDAACYMGAQLTGAALAAAGNYAVYSRGIADFETANKITRGARGSWRSFTGAFGMVPNKALVSVPGCLVAEAAMTAALGFTVLALTDDSKTVPAGAVPALVGTTVTLLAAQFGPVTGCGMNPARDLGPRLVTAAAGWKGAALSRAWWTYTLGPMLGAVVGGYLYDHTLGADAFAGVPLRNAAADAQD